MPETLTMADCPYCPDSAPAVRRVNDWYVQVECLECYSKGPERRTDSEAIAAWNQIAAWRRRSKGADHA